MPNEKPCFFANGTIAPCRFVKQDTTADDAVLQAGAGDEPVGISQEGMKRAPGLAGSDAAVAAESGDSLQLFGFGDMPLLEYGGTVTRGDWLKPDANGKGVTASANDIAGAKALKSGVLGTKAPVIVLRTKV